MTRAGIIVKREDGKYQGYYIRADGYPDYLGRILIECGSDIKRVERNIYDMVGASFECEGLAPEKFGWAWIDYFYTLIDGEWYVYEESPDDMVLLKEELERIYQRMREQMGLG